MEQIKLDEDDFCDGGSQVSFDIYISFSLPHQFSNVHTHIWGILQKPIKLTHMVARGTPQLHIDGTKGQE